MTDDENMPHAQGETGSGDQATPQWMSPTPADPAPQPGAWQTASAQQPHLVQPLPYDVPAAQSSWPLVLGIIAIVFGAGGVLMGIWTALSSIMLRSMSQMAASMGPNPGFMMFPEARLLVMQGALMGVVALLLLIGGVGLASRRSYGVRFTRIWAIIKLFSTVATVYLGYLMQSAQMTAMQQQMQTASAPASVGNNPAVAMQSQAMAMQTQMFEWIYLLSVAFGLAWGWALPIFMLIWLSRRKVREEVRAWA